MTTRLRDKIAIVTGASRGIGKAIAVALGRQGATVLVLWCRADAPPAEWSKLAVKPTAPAAAPAGAPAPSGPPAQVGPAGWDAASLNEAIAAVPLTPYTFPDNTGSIGIAQGRRATPDELLRDADVALYQAKAAGKNCALPWLEALVA